MFYILVYYDLLSLRPPPLPLFLYAKGGVEFTSKIRVNYNLLNQDSIYTCLFYKIYL
jgi:hypothetical protein